MYKKLNKENKKPKYTKVDADYWEIAAKFYL